MEKQLVCYRRVACSHRGGIECQGCPHDKIHEAKTENEIAHKSFCINANEDGGQEVACYPV